MLTGAGLLQTDCPLCHLINGVKATEGTEELAVQ